MRAKVRRGLVWGALSAALLLTWSGSAAAANCALYARAETGVFLYGAAGGWWDEAAGRYQRGQSPALGAILVFKRSGYTPSGHVAVVSGVVSSREILIDHANWYRGRVSRGMSAIDTSPNNDWTSVAVRDLGSGAYGRRSPTYGFVYPSTGARQVAAAQAIVGYDADLADGRAGARWNPQTRFVHVALTTDDRHRRGHKSATGHSARRKSAPSHAGHAAGSHFRTHPKPAAKTKTAEAAKRARS
jgi:hypothetical protein